MLYTPAAKTKVAYFSMEIGLDQNIRTYSGGLGILAGDTIRSAADLALPMVVMTLLYRKGYLHQKIDATGWQTEEEDHWTPSDYLTELPNRISLRIDGRHVYLRAWRYDVGGVTGHKVPVFYLDSDLPENHASDRELTHRLYAGDDFYRLAQEKILGIGGVRMLRNLGYGSIERFHMNEGHAALLTLELLDQVATHKGREHVEQEDIEVVRDLCVFTTHTPVAAGHDKFTLELANKVLHRDEISSMQNAFSHEGMLNLTYTAMNMSRYINGVAKKHGEVSREMFPGHSIDSVTNGVHAGFWTSPYMSAVFDKHIPGWRIDNYALRFVLKIPREDIWQAHQAAKVKLVEYIKETMNQDFDPEVFTIGSARRATPYKRGDLMFRDLERLESIVKKQGPIQAVFAGKAHPRDTGGKDIIKSIFAASKVLKDKVKVVFLPDYDIDMAKILIPGVDIWLNTPEPPLEASGTSGMKAAVNGVPSLSILDGWWIEGHVEGVTGWAIGEDAAGQPQKPDTNRDAKSLYDKLEHAILPMYYGENDKFKHICRNSIALNGSFFNTQRMVQEYVLKAYFLQKNYLKQ